MAFEFQNLEKKFICINHPCPLLNSENFFPLVNSFSSKWTQLFSMANPCQIGQQGAECLQLDNIVL